MNLRVLLKEDRELFHAISTKPASTTHEVFVDLGLPLVGICGTRLRFPVKTLQKSSRLCAQCERELGRIHKAANGDQDQLPHLWWS
jgi:hypothetical protein